MTPEQQVLEALDYEPLRRRSFIDDFVANYMAARVSDTYSRLGALKALVTARSEGVAIDAIVFAEEAWNALQKGQETCRAEESEGL